MVMQKPFRSHKVTYDAVFAINTVVTQPSFPGAFSSSSHQVRDGSELQGNMAVIQGA